MTHSTLVNHNGGPPLDGETPFNLRYMRIHINDWIASTRSLNAEQECLFLRLQMQMYDRGGALPNDDVANARIVRFEIRTYRRVLRELIELGKIHVQADVASPRLFHPRTLREIEEAFREHRRRKEAALEREEKARSARVAEEIRRTSGELRPDFQPTSAGLRPDIGPKSDEDRPQLSADLSGKSLEINACTATTVTTIGPQPSRARAFPKPKPNINTYTQELPLSPDGEASDGSSRVGSVHWAVETYNEVARRRGLSTATTISNGRANAVRARLKEYGAPGWQRMLANVDRSKFLQGGGGNGSFRATLDWLVKPANFVKVHDGNYGNGAHAPSLGDPEQIHSQDEYQRELDAIAAREGAL